MPYMILLASFDTDTDSSGIMGHQYHWIHMMPVVVVLYDQKSHVTSNFNCID